MASLTRGTSFRRQGSSGRSWADNLNFGEHQQAFNHDRRAKGDGITKKAVMVPDDDPTNSSGPLKVTRSGSTHREDRRKSRPGMFSWLKNRFRKARS